MLIVHDPLPESRLLYWRLAPLRSPARIGATPQRHPGSETSTRPLLPLAVFLAGAISIIGCARGDTYRPVYYPDRSDLSTYTRGPAFDNLAQARQWAEDRNRQRRDPNWTYEVGKNCRPLESSDIEVCEETLQ